MPWSTETRLLRPSSHSTWRSWPPPNHQPVQSSRQPATLQHVSILELKSEAVSLLSFYWTGRYFQTPHSSALPEPPPPPPVMGISFLISGHRPALFGGFPVYGHDGWRCVGVVGIQLYDILFVGVGQLTKPANWLCEERGAKVWFLSISRRLVRGLVLLSHLTDQLTDWLVSWRTCFCVCMFERVYVCWGKGGSEIKVLNWPYFSLYSSVSGLLW